MDWVKLFTHYDSDMTVATGDDSAEVMFTRGLAYCGRNRTGGFIPATQLHHLTRHPARAKRIAGALTRKAPDGSMGPWEAVDGGYRVRNWNVYQDQLVGIEERRRSDRERKRRQRERESDTPTEVTGPSRDSHADVHGERKRKRKTAAAAADTSAAAAADLPGPISILASKIRSHTALAGLRFDTLSDEQTTHLVGLIEQHGDDRLVAVARDTLRDPAPTYVTAFLGTWTALPPPGRTLHAVVARYCPTHSTKLTPAGVCSGCSADERVGDAR